MKKENQNLKDLMDSMDNENHGFMSKEVWDNLKSKYLELDKEINNPSTIVKPKSSLILP